MKKNVNELKKWDVFKLNGCGNIAIMCSNKQHIYMGDKAICSSSLGSSGTREVLDMTVETFFNKCSHYTSYSSDETKSRFDKLYHEYLQGEHLVEQREQVEVDSSEIMSSKDYKWTAIGSERNILRLNSTFYPTPMWHDIPRLDDRRRLLLII